MAQVLPFFFVLSPCDCWLNSWSVTVVIDATGLARQLGAADAAILRNDYAKHVGGTTLGSVQLSEQHPLILPTQNAVDARRSRLKSRLPEKRLVRTRLVDLFRNA